MLIQGKCNGTVWGRDYIVKWVTGFRKP
jgi:hypothetical protein